MPPVTAPIALPRPGIIIVPAVNPRAVPKVPMKSPPRLLTVLILISLKNSLLEMTPALSFL